MTVIIIIIIIVALVVVAMSRIRIHLEYHRNQQDDRFFVNIALARGLLSFKTEFTGVDLEKKLSGLALKVESEVEAEVGGTGTGLNMGEKITLDYDTLNYVYQVIQRVIYHIRIYKGTLLNLVRLTKIKELDWKTRFGLGDAAATGVATGVLWSIKSMVIQGLYRFAKGSLQTTCLKVQPDFVGATLNIDLRCIFDIKIGHIIIAGCKILIIRMKLLFLRTVKGV